VSSCCFVQVIAVTGLDREPFFQMAMAAMPALLFLPAVLLETSLSSLVMHAVETELAAVDLFFARLHLVSE
jgi:hypothetical protein